MTSRFDLYVLLTRTRDALIKVRQNELSAHHVTVPVAAALNAIAAGDENATPTDIAYYMFREPHSVSELLSRMEKIGLITKSKDLKKKNLVKVALTEQGQEILQKLIKHKQSIDNVMSCLSDTESKQFYQYLSRIQKQAHEELARQFRPLLIKHKRTE